MHTWLSIHAWQFEKLMVLDGSVRDDHAARIRLSVTRFDNVIYANEHQLSSPPPLTDNGLRGVAWSLLSESTVSLGSWIVIAHPDEFYLQRFSDLATKAEADNANVLNMNILYALPNTEDRHHLNTDLRGSISTFNILHIVRYCKSNYSFQESRMYKYDDTEIRWGTSHAHTVPDSFPARRDAGWTGWYVHYKIHNFDEDALASDGKLVHSSWSHVESGSDIYSNLVGNNAKLCTVMADELCSSEGFEPPCKMPVP